MYKISVIIPVFNVEKYVETAVDSVLYKQDLSDIQVILVNDGSTDNSGEIIRKLYGPCQNVVIINQKNAGLSEARNVGLEVAQGKYIIYLDSDDFLSENCLKKLYDTITENDADLLVFGGKKVVQDFNDITLNTMDYGLNKKGIFETGLDAYCFLKKEREYYTGVYYQLVRKSILYENNIKFYPGIIHEDHLYTFQVFMFTGKTICMPLKVYNYRVRNNSIMTDSGRYSERFRGLAITYFEMKKIRAQKKLSKLESRVVENHLKEIKWWACKYLCRMIEAEENEQLMLVKDFVRDKIDLKSTFFICMRRMFRVLFPNKR